MKSSRSEFIDLPDARLHVRRWDKPGAPRLFMLHGWMDCSASFQFLIDAFAGEWDIVAPDLRGFGQSQWQHRNYLFLEHCRDLAGLVEHYSADEPIRLLGHSMGGNVAAVFAGMRPARVARLAMLESFGVPIFTRDTLPDRMATWLRETLEGATPLRTYASLADYAKRLRKANPRLSDERAQFLATHFSRHDEHGRITAAADPWHRVASPHLLHVEDFRCIWGRIEAPTLFAVAKDSVFLRRFDECPEEYRKHLASFRRVTEVVVPDAGHNLHHDQPQHLAPIVESFLLAD